MAFSIQFADVSVFTLKETVGLGEGKTEWPWNPETALRFSPAGKNVASDCIREKVVTPVRMVGVVPLKSRLELETVVPGEIAICIVDPLPKRLPADHPLATFTFDETKVHDDRLDCDEELGSVAKSFNPFMEYYKICFQSEAMTEPDTHIKVYRVGVKGADYTLTYFTGVHGGLAAFVLRLAHVRPETVYYVGLDAAGLKEGIRYVNALFPQCQRFGFINVSIGLSRLPLAYEDGELLEVETAGKELGEHIASKDLESLRVENLCGTAYCNVTPSDLLAGIPRDNKELRLIIKGEKDFLSRIDYMFACKLADAVLSSMDSEPPVPVEYQLVKLISCARDPTLILEHLKRLAEYCDDGFEYGRSFYGCNDPVLNRCKQQVTEWARAQGMAIEEFSTFNKPSYDMSGGAPLVVEKFTLKPPEKTVCICFDC